MKHTITICGNSLVGYNKLKKNIEGTELQSIINRDWIYNAEYETLTEYLFFNKLTWRDIINYSYIIGFYSPYEELPTEINSTVDGYEVTFETKPKQFKLYFEFFGYKMCTTVEAYSIEEAKEMVKNKIKFYDNVKTAPQEDNTNKYDFTTLDYLKNIFGMK